MRISTRVTPHYDIADSRIESPPSVTKPSATIKMITAEDTYQIRQRVLWPDKPISSIKIAEDKNALHIGAFVDGKLVGIVSLFRDNENFQFRKLAVLAEHRGCGIGQKLINECIIKAREQQVKILWCDARHSALDFYKKLDFTIDPETFIKNDKEYQKAYLDTSKKQAKL